LTPFFGIKRLEEAIAREKSYRVELLGYVKEHEVWRARRDTRRTG
jgi:hypothetical protein